MKYSVVFEDGTHVDVEADSVSAAADEFGMEGAVAIIQVPAPVHVHRGCHYAVAEQALRSE